jgi:hypothetical protein
MPRVVTLLVAFAVVIAFADSLQARSQQRNAPRQSQALQTRSVAASPSIASPIASDAWMNRASRSFSGGGY